MEPSVIVAIVASIIAFAGFIFGIYKHFSTRKVARVIYEVSQISDYAVPKSFFEELTTAPMTIGVESSGSDKAENVVLRLKTITTIDKHTIVPKDIAEPEVDDNNLRITVPLLNPTDKFKIFLNCKGSPADNQLESLELTHSTGVGVDKRSSAYTKIKFSFLFLDFEFDLNTRALKILRAGPWLFR